MPVDAAMCVLVAQRRQWTAFRADRTDREDEATCRSASEVSLLERERKGESTSGTIAAAHKRSALSSRISPNIFK